jgi:hypothetical protein
MRAAIEQSEQKTLDNLPEVPKKKFVRVVAQEPKKQIVITDIDSVTKEDELVVRVGFRLLPSKTVFSKLTAELYFDDQKLSTLQFSILQGPLATDDSEFTSALDMRGISAGSHSIKVEMHEPSASGEKRSRSAKEVAIIYQPQSRESRLIKIPIVKKIEGEGITIVSESEKDIYREIEEAEKRELASQRDEW